MKYTLQKRTVNDLKLSNEVFEIIGLPKSKHIAIEAKHFGYYDIPVITSPDNIVLTHYDAVQAAMENEVKEMDVMVVEGLDLNELPRFVNYGLYAKTLNEEQRYNLVQFLKDYLRKNPRGKEWAAQLKGADVNEKIGSIVNYHRETIKAWVRSHKKTFPEYQKQIRKRKIPPIPIKKDNFNKSGFAPHIRPNEPGDAAYDYTFFELKHLQARVDVIEEDLIKKEKITLLYRGTELPLRFEHQFKQEDNRDFLNFYTDENKLGIQIMVKDLYNLVLAANNAHARKMDDEADMALLSQSDAKFKTTGVPLIYPNQIQNTHQPRA